MNQAGANAFLNNYTPVGDLCCIAVCFALLILIVFSFIRRTKSFRIFLSSLFCLILACFFDLLYNVFAIRPGAALWMVYTFRTLYHLMLFLVFFLYTLYIAEVTSLEHRKKRAVTVAATAILLFVTVADTQASVLNVIRAGDAPDRIISAGTLFLVGYLLFAAMDVILLATVRNRLYKKVMRGFYGTVVLSFVILLRQRLTGQSSFTAFTFVFPAIAMFYIMHATPYDAQLGAIDARSLEDTIRYSHSRNRSFFLMSLLLPDYAKEGEQMPESIRAAVRKNAFSFFRGAILFLVGPGHMILMFPKNKNPDYEHRISNIMQAFQDQYRVFRLDYKIVICESQQVLGEKNEYSRLIRHVQRNMEINTVRRVGPDDIRLYNRNEYILSELADIYRMRDKNDPRVLVYCQPVYNLSTMKYDTAEALMRLDLTDLGVILPDQFIPLAEEHGFIHVLTEIILHKTCEEIRRLSASGYLISRISVNVSMLELKEDHFCEDITGIISRSGISGDRIAIELTESRSDSDFEVMKTKIEELKEQGVKFYLDDFGTGYSNMERIMELPFDIIKFDRSMVHAIGESERSEKIVGNLASLFHDLDYSVLYEGVETDSEEKLCRQMNASYLQGYKYSEPVPIDQLINFVPRKEQAG